MTKQIKHKPSTWSRLTGIRIIDADGWRIDGKSINAPIDAAEWEQRMCMSTVERKVQILRMPTNPQTVTITGRNHNWKCILNELG